MLLALCSSPGDSLTGAEAAETEMDVLPLVWQKVLPKGNGYHTLRRAGPLSLPGVAYFQVRRLQDDCRQRWAIDDD